VIQQVFFQISVLSPFVVDSVEACACLNVPPCLIITWHITHILLWKLSVDRPTVIWWAHWARSACLLSLCCVYLSSLFPSCNIRPMFNLLDQSCVSVFVRVWMGSLRLDIEIKVLRPVVYLIFQVPARAQCPHIFQSVLNFRWALTGSFFSILYQTSESSPESCLLLDICSEG